MHLSTAGRVPWLVHALLWLALCAVLSAAARTTIVYPHSESVRDERSAYAIQLLGLALSKADIEYDMRPSEIKMQQNRALLQLANGVDVNVVWSMTSKEREKELLPIRIPLDKGLLGWRIFLIHKESKPGFEQVQTLDQLKQFEAGQGHDWPDTEILRANGLPVYGSVNYESLFKMLQFKRFDYFPRSVGEVWDEEKNHPGMDLEIEQTIVLYYPAALYFFVNKKDKALAAALENGLRAALADGSFDKLFYQYNGERINRANLKNRKLFVLDNPLLPDETPLQQKELWLHY